MKDGKKFKHTRHSQKRQQHRGAECKAEVAESAAARGAVRPGPPLGAGFCRPHQTLWPAVKFHR